MEQDTLRISLVQSPIIWCDRRANLQLFQNRLATLQNQTDLVILPEVFTSGFSMDKIEEVADSKNGEIIQTIKQWAFNYNLAIIGSFFLKDDNKFYNRAFLVTPKGDFFYYNKRHLFRMAHEERIITSGDTRPIFKYKGWNICLQVCYDLRFPVWSRNKDNAYDLLVYVANWPTARKDAWRILLPARAIENSAYVCGVNRIGEDINGISYQGDSMLISPKGKILSNTIANTECIETITISLSDLTHFRKKFPVWQDADNFKIIPT